MTTALAIAFWTIIGGAVAVLLLAAVATAMIYRDWRCNGGHW